MLLSLLGAIPNILQSASDAYNKHQETKQLKHETRLKIEIAKQQLAKEYAKADLQLNQSRIKSTSKWFKHCITILIFLPFIITSVFPEYGAQIFANWRHMPDFYAKLIVGLTFIIWGYTAGGFSIKEMFRGADTFFKSYARKRINKKLLFKTLRAIKHRQRKPLTQDEVDLVNKMLDKESK